MEENLKQLLLKDLCARLPYKVNIQVKDWAVLDAELEIGHINRLQNDNLELKPYLRPMSSMTEEENSELGELITIYDDVDWMLAHHFDVHNLIEKGLALEAPEGMYKNE